MNTDTKNIILAPFNLLYRISPKLELKLLFRIKQGYRLDLNNPKTYNEKIQWIKLYDKNPLMPKCVDKYTVREYIKDVGCQNILNDILWNGFNPDEIPFEKLPNKVVIKVTHGSTFNIICTDKTKLDIENSKKKLKKWLKEKFIPCYGEWFYGIEKPRIIVEKFIDSDEDLKDFKVFCFDGVPKVIGVYSNRFNGKLCQELYDVDWNLINEHTGHYELPEKLTPKPNNLSEMLKYAEKISNGFRHVRVDFFNPDNRLIFGEMTFTGSAGFGKYSSRDFAERMGKYLNIN